MPYPALASSGDTASVNRKNKFLIASVAMVGASAIAVTPVAQNTAVVEQAKTLAYDLTAVMDATASPLDVYGELFETTFSNLQHLGGAVAANPAPLLSQIVENQLGYAEKAGAAFEAIPTNLQKWYDGAKGKAMLDDAQAKLQEGDLAGAYELFNHSMLYAFQGAFGSLIAPGFILSGIPRGQGQTYQTGIPEQIAQNFTNLIAATFTSTVVVSTLFQGAVAIVSGPAFELARIADALSTTVAAGDFEGALNAVVNTPGILVNAALNGFKYADPDESGEGGNSEWPALLTWAEPGEQGGTRIVPGLLQNLLVNLPKAFAEAIDNTPPVVTPEADAARTIAVAQEVTDELTVSPLSKLAKSTLVPVKVETPAIEPAKVETAVEPVKEEVLKEETPSIEAAPVAADDSAAVTTPAVDKTAEANANADGTTTGKAKISDRIKAKFSEAKEARQAKAAAAKEAKAAAKEAKAEAKKAKAESKAQSKKSKESKSKESKKDSGSSS
ncbi:hypothetical protein [Mycobacterium sp. GA-1841]|uniref:hypothetical protein n=1 Tax=Mycobacterium sp. GA-1841 TaxID=1834154 RepID=UPI001115897D|nr:hypothetical protein [Mycobacterium sp. GA-1841]